MKLCCIKGCDRPHDANGFCRSHGARIKRWGSPFGGSTGKGAAARFIENVVLTYTGDDCLKWPYGTNGKGYGVFHVNKRSIGAHCYVCERAHGKKPSITHEAAHSCGKGHELCVNPRHLRWATRSENMADKIKHDTHNRGTRNKMSRLTPEKVKDIRALRGTDAQHRVAAKFGVSQMIISKIWRGEAWGWLE